MGRRKLVPEPAVERFIEAAALASDIGTRTALRIMALLATEADRAPHTTGERGDE